MLITLSIKNFVLIESLSLDFSSGFHAISGDTGAGKSIILDSILFALGHKFDSKIIRLGSDMASVTAHFDVSNEVAEIASEHGLDIAEGLIIKRQQFANGKKKFFINDEPASSKLVALLGDSLIEMHGQCGYGKLLNPASHLKILDKYGQLDELKEAVEEKYKEYKKIESDIEEIEKNRNFIEREVDYLKHSVSELASKCPKEGEEAALSDKRIKLRGFEKRRDAINNLQQIYSESLIPSKISSMQKIASNQDESFGKLIENLDQINIYLGELEESLEELSREVIEENLEDIEARLFEIKDLSRKYKIPADNLAEHLQNMERELEELEDKIDNSYHLKKDLAKAKSKYDEFSKLLSDKRKKVAKDFENKVSKELAPLNMANCRWFVEITEREPSANGIDNVRFTAITNPGTNPAPIDKIASGGEMARMMLAVKLVLFDKDYVETIIFDEIDTGLGGRIADSVGLRLKALSKVAQTIIITHQPQVASKADYNILVTKEAGKSTAEILDIAGKNKEIARMISGAKITDKALEAAKELIGQ